MCCLIWAAMTYLIRPEVRSVATNVLVKCLRCWFVWRVAASLVAWLRSVSTLCEITAQLQILTHVWQLRCNSRTRWWKDCIGIGECGCVTKHWVVRAGWARLTRWRLRNTVTGLRERVWATIGQVSRPWGIGPSTTARTAATIIAWSLQRAGRRLWCARQSAPRWPRTSRVHWRLTRSDRFWGSD